MRAILARMCFAALFDSRVAPSDVIQVRALNQPDLDTEFGMIRRTER